MSIKIGIIFFSYRPFFFYFSFIGIIVVGAQLSHAPDYPPESSESPESSEIF